MFGVVEHDLQSRLRPGEPVLGVLLVEEADARLGHDRRHRPKDGCVVKRRQLQPVSGVNGEAHRGRLQSLEGEVLRGFPGRLPLHADDAAETPRVKAQQQGIELCGCDLSSCQVVGVGAGAEPVWHQPPRLEGGERKQRVQLMEELRVVFQFGHCGQSVVVHGGKRK